MGKPWWTPAPDDTLPEWLLNKTIEGTPDKDVRAIIILALWELWKHRNGIVFDGDSPSLTRLVRRYLSEGRTWKMAGLIRTDMGSFFEQLHMWAMDET